jgi:hypothetical protein
LQRQDGSTDVTLTHSTFGFAVSFCSILLMLQDNRWSTLAFTRNLNINDLSPTSKSQAQSELDCNVFFYERCENATLTLLHDRNSAAIKSIECPYIIYD